MSHFAPFNPAPHAKPSICYPPWRFLAFAFSIGQRPAGPSGRCSAADPSPSSPKSIKGDCCCTVAYLDAAPLQQRSLRPIVEERKAGMVVHVEAGHRHEPYIREKADTVVDAAQSTYPLEEAVVLGVINAIQPARPRRKCGCSGHSRVPTGLGGTARREARAHGVHVWRVARHPDLPGGCQSVGLAALWHRPCRPCREEAATKGEPRLK